MFDFKGLIGALFNREPQEGVHDYKSATMFMQELPESDILQAHIEIVKALQQLNGNGRVSLKERMRTVPYLDDKARTLQHHLVDIYCGRLIDDHAAPHQVLPSILAYWRQMGEAYRLCIKQATQTGARGLDKQLQLFCLRALSHYNQEVKWALLRYLEVDARAWRNLHRLYHYAEQHQFALMPLQPYEHAEITDARREYMQAMMLALSQPEKLQPAQIELAAQWLKRWSGRVELEMLIRPNRQLFAVNIAGSSAPKRLRRDMVGENWRYWFTEALVLHVRELHDRLLRGEDPLDHGLPPESAEPANLALMLQLVNLWSRDVPAPVRRFERHATRKRLRVVRGLEEVIQFLRTPGGQGRRFDTEHWEVANESAGGYGVNYNGKGDDRLQVGEIVGLGQEETQGLTVGVIRRITRHRDGQVEIGIENLAANPVVVELKPTQGERSFYGLYSPDSGINGQGRFLMLPQAFFAAHREFQLSAQGKSYRIRLDPALEQTVNAAISRFSVLQRIAA